MLNKCPHTFSPPEPAVTIKEKKGNANNKASESVKRFQLPEEWTEDFIFFWEMNSRLNGTFFVFGNFYHKDFLCNMKRQRRRTLFGFK